MKIDAWYSLMTFRKKPVALVLVDDGRMWGRVEAKADAKMHPTVAQFVASQLGALRKRIERGDVPRRVDLDSLAGKFSGDVRLSAPMPIVSAETPDEMVKRLWR